MPPTHPNAPNTRNVPPTTPKRPQSNSNAPKAFTPIHPHLFTHIHTLCKGCKCCGVLMCVLGSLGALELLWGCLEGGVGGLGAPYRVLWAFGCVGVILGYNHSS